MAQYLPPTYQAPPPANRSRASSSASMNKYVPGNYQPPPPPAPPPAQGGYPAQQTRPRGPSFADQQVPSRPPIPQAGSYGLSPAATAPQNQLHPGYPDERPSQPYPYPPSADRNGYTPPSTEPRRPSASSTRSHHSQRSHRSHRSQDSRRSQSRRSSDARERERRSYERDLDRKERERRHSDNRDYRPPKRANTYRPSWGGTLFSMFDTIKDALGPRDKY